MPHRFLFYCGTIEEDPELIALRGEEHHHLSRVTRRRIRDEIWVTDGDGRIFSCTVEQIEKNQSILRVSSIEERRRSSGELVLGLACIKKDRFERALSMCTEIGITRCVPVACDNSMIRSFSNATLQRFRRKVLETMKQSFQTILPKIGDAADFDSFVEMVHKECRIVVGSPSGGKLEELDKRDDVAIIVGPEAGFSKREVEILEDVGASFIRVSGNRLRSETAAVSLTSLVSLLRDSL